MPDNLFAQPLSKSSLVYLLVWYPPLHTPYIFSPNHCLLFATHAHTNATCFAVVSTLCHLIYLELYLCRNATHPSDHSHVCPLKCHLIFFSYRPSLTSMLYTTLIYLIHKQWYQLPEFISANSNSGLHSCISIYIHTQHADFTAAVVHQSIINMIMSFFGPVSLFSKFFFT